MNMPAEPIQGGKAGGYPKQFIEWASMMVPR
jgi:hypothetical protein